MVKRTVMSDKWQVTRKKKWRLLLFCLSLVTFHSSPLFGQQPQAQSGQPLYAVNAKYVNGVAPGYWPTAGTGLVLNLSAGTAFCGGSVVNYAGTTLTLTASATNNVFLLLSTLGAPATPVLSSVAGGALAATTYFVKITYVNPSGETTPSAEASLAVAANNLLVVTSPLANQNATGYNVYVSTSTNTETKQNGATPIAIGTNWTEPTTGLVTGAAMPTADTTACAPWFNTTGFLSGQTPIAKVVTGATAITTITDVRTHFLPIPRTIFVSHCSGTATASATLWLFPIGQISALTCTVATASAGIPMTGAGTLKNLQFKSGTAGIAGDAVTVVKNAVATALTCTYGTLTTCNDTVDTVAVVAGDLITVRIFTGALDTTADVHVSFELQ